MGVSFRQGKETGERLRGGEERRGPIHAHLTSTHLKHSQTRNCKKVLIRNPAELLVQVAKQEVVAGVFGCGHVVVYIVFVWDIDTYKSIDEFLLQGEPSSNAAGCPSLS